VTGLIPVLEKFEVKDIVVSGTKSDTGVFADVDQHMEDEEATMHIARRGDVIDFQDGVTATMLHPRGGETFKETNSVSISMVITYGEQTFLLTGDLPIAYESLLMSSGMLPKKITVYKAGHHGSKTSSGEQLLSYIKPEYAVISAGADNKYGHPNVEALGRLQKYSKEILSTAERGTITFISDGRIMEVETVR
jgi:competence protein ComEC